MKVFPRLGFNELISKFSADRVIKSGRDVLPNRIGGVGSHKIMSTFTDITKDLIASSSINSINSGSTDVEVTQPVPTDNSGLQTLVSTDGKETSPISSPLSYTEKIDDEVVEKIREDGNTIRLGSSAYKRMS
jgi:hypothetical protein